MLRRPIVICILIALMFSAYPPAALAQSIAEACVDALATDANRWDGIPMDVFVWDGMAISLGEIDSNPISLCRASGPLEILPPSQLIGCVLVGTDTGLVGDDLACGAYRDIRLLDDSSLMWIARSSAASNEVTIMAWNGAGFDPGRPYTACWDDPFAPITDQTECGR
ncbi:MAG TPA: hypothetical protein VHX16_15970 [Chloroflexota bacterium]|nr:hypothetical protein [Chloroflexota bacterium]